MYSAHSNQVRSVDLDLQPGHDRKLAIDYFVEFPVKDVTERQNPCQPSPCGANAVCRESYDSALCTCLPDFYGNPYENCRPECLIDSDCQFNRACIRSKCQDPCPGTCGFNALCQVVNHIPTCSCRPGNTGNPFRSCRPLAEPRKLSIVGCVKHPPHPFNAIIYFE